MSDMIRNILNNTATAQINQLVDTVQHEYLALLS